MKTPRFLRRFWVIAVGTLFFANLLSANIVTFEFTGEVIDILDPDGSVSTTPILLGSPVQASLRYNTTTPEHPQYADDLTRGMFIGPGWLKVRIAGLDFEQTTTVQVDILHGGNGGQELFQAMASFEATTWPSEVPPFRHLALLFWETAPPYDLLADANLPAWMDFPGQTSPKAL